MTQSNKIVLVVGGTGAQGVPVIEGSLETAEARSLSSLSHVTLFQGDCYNESDLQKAFEGVQLAFVNTNGFAIGEKAEIYWGIRMYELARQHHLEHFVWGGVDYGSKLGGFAKKYRCGHLDGKNKVTEYLKSQPTSPMAWSVLSSCPYIEMTQGGGSWGPRKDESDTWVFSVPLGNGAAPMIHLEDLGKYARWIFDNRSESNGMNLEVATCHVSLKDLVEAFQNVTGKPAKSLDLTPEEYFSRKDLNNVNPDMKLAHGTDGSDSTVMTARENFTGFHHVWRDNLASRDYKLLDKILPDRVKTLEEWMRKSNYTAGEFKPVLVDGKRGYFR
ncbi:hypothetical protein D0Z07_0046 [Hyphodiscus hymeniophilus]|uniref:NmrA-like domain-containing protein n=1 Tax=Hyphodiscus hymeniophilus TaxID=353542 RepID=A0A9P7B0R7_9HELO|nr:hypothetical protein D0Z07_0046 [Hyphodiscus hymeniophilus]